MTDPDAAAWLDPPPDRFDRAVVWAVDVAAVLVLAGVVWWLLG